MASFVHLRVKSAYSLLEGAVRPDELAELARANAMPAVAVTDINNLFGVYEISETLAKAGVQPIVGALLSVELSRTTPAAVRLRARRSRRTAAAGAERGRLSQSHQASERRLSGSRAGRLAACQAGPMLAAHAEGLIALTGGPGGPLNQLLVEGQHEAAAALLLTGCSTIFGDRLYVELQRHGLPRNAPPKTRCSIWPMTKDLPLVATNDVHFGTADMYRGP